MFTADVVIVGGGPAGAAVALELARRGLSSVVLEAQPAAQLKVGESLPPNINPLLDHFGLTERLRLRGNLPAHGNRFVWGSGSIRERDFIFAPNGNGWRLDRRTFEEELMQAAVAAGVHWQYGQRLTACVRESDNLWQLTATSSHGAETYLAKFVVDATGRDAHLTRSLGARRVVYDRLIGLAAYFQQPAASEDSFTLVEAVSSGWWYSSSLPDKKLIAVYMTDSDLLKRNTRETDGWRALLNEAKHTPDRVGEHVNGQPRILAAHTVRLTSVAGDGWLAVGDAAIAFDPLASHGISMAMSSGFHAAAAIFDYLGGQQDSLRVYERIIDASFAQYLLMRHETYLTEQRWPNEEFWRRRHRGASQRRKHPSADYAD